MGDVKRFDPYYLNDFMESCRASMEESNEGDYVFSEDYDKLTEQNKLLREALGALVLTSYENEKKLADRLYRDFEESDALVEAKELLEVTK